MNKKIKIQLPPITKTFDVPSREDILKLKVGDDVKVVFVQKGRPNERMWVKVVKLGTESVTGTLINNPICVDLQEGAEITFHPLCIIDMFIYSEEALKYPSH